MIVNPRYLVLIIVGCLTLPACAQQEAATERAEVRSVFTGTITVDAQIDATQDYRGFEVLVAVDADGEPDTLGYAITDSTGAFNMDVVAPVRGRYSLLISRRGQILKVGVLAVAHADTASLTAVLPMGNRPLRVRSKENSAWLAYENTTALHRQSLLELVQSGEYNESAVSDLVHQTSMILWGMRSTFGGTMGSELAAAEAVSMVTNWNDSLALARAREIEPENINYVEIAQAARTAQARLAGQEAAIALLEEFATRATTEEHRAALAFEIIAARLDSMQHDAAMEAALSFKEAYADSPYADWGTRAIYELENLIPGKLAPLFSVRDAAGDSLHLAQFRGQHVLLEFYHPQDDVYERELEGRRRLYDDAAGLEIVSISMALDPLVDEAFFDSRDIPGRHVPRPPGLALLYNINVLPTRFLVGPDGRIVAKYVGNAMAAIYQDVVGAQ